jgi:hypothetical protein
MLQNEHGAKQSRFICLNSDVHEVTPNDLIDIDPLLEGTRASDLRSSPVLNDVGFVISCRRYGTNCQSGFQGPSSNRQDSS